MIVIAEGSFLALLFRQWRPFNPDHGGAAIFYEGGQPPGVEPRPKIQSQLRGIRLPFTRDLCQISLGQDGECGGIMRSSQKQVLDDERPADLLLWWKDGRLDPHRASIPTKTIVSIGRTNSKRALGFMVFSGRVFSGRKPIDFVLDYEQVTALAQYLPIMLRRLKKPTSKNV
jgi:hypothetical protein